MSFDMQIRARKIIVFAIAAALAVANGFAPRHAQAGMHSHTVPAVASKAHHHDHTAGQTAHHHDDEIDQAAAQALCHNDGEGTQQQPNSPLHNCCVASCSAVAFIFASFSFDAPLPNADYGVFPPVQLTPALLTSADPPPR
jgi:hypothetical protein